MQGVRNSYTVSSMYCLAILRKGRDRCYLKRMKDDERWQITPDVRKAHQFDFSAECEEAINAYCHTYGQSDYSFSVLRITEEIMAQHGS